MRLRFPECLRLMAQPNALLLEEPSAPLGEI
jgi:hypothetical protein